MNWHHDRRMQESTAPRIPDGPGARGQSKLPAVLPGLLTAIKEAAGSSLVAMEAWVGSSGMGSAEQHEGRSMGEGEGAQDILSRRGPPGVAALGWFPHSWESIPNEGDATPAL